MRETLKTSIRSVTLGLVALAFMGAGACQTEVARHCQTLNTQEARTACSVYCETHPGLSANSDLVTVCQLGQLEYLTKPQISAEELKLACLRHFREKPDQAEACVLGVTAEALRQPRTPFGSAGERETGN